MLLLSETNNIKLLEYDDIKKYYQNLLMLNPSDTKIIISLAYYYEEVEKNYSEMKKYFELAIKYGCVEAMVNLAYYYEEIEQDYEKMNQYYLMGCEHGDIESMENLESFYFDKSKLHQILMSSTKKNKLISNKLKNLESK